MLILSRRVGESLRINDDIAVTVLGIQGMQARIGINAPSNVAVHREEIYQRIEVERAASSRHIDARIKEAAAEPVLLSVVFALPNAQAAGALINQLPHGRRVFGTQAKVHSMTTVPLEPDVRPAQQADYVDPRDLFIAANPVGASPDELEKGRNGFVDERTHADYLVFLSEYRAVQEASACAS